MGMPYKRTIRIDNKFVERTFNPYRDFYAVGTGKFKDAKGNTSVKTYILRMDNTTNVLARQEANDWAKEERLTLDYVGGFKNESKI